MTLQRSPGKESWQKKQKQRNWGSTPSWLRRESLLLLTLVAVVLYFALRVTQLRSTRDGSSTIRTVLTTTQGEGQISPAESSFSRKASCKAQ